MVSYGMPVRGIGQFRRRIENLYSMLPAVTNVMLSFERQDHGLIAIKTGFCTNASSLILASDTL